MAEGIGERASDEPRDGELTDEELAQVAGGAGQSGDPAISSNAQVLKLQMQMQQENQAFSAVSNVLKTRSDTQESLINNIK